MRQDFQALIKQEWHEIGVETELKTVDPSVFFGGDAGAADTMQKFHADIEMYANNFEGNNPEPYLAQQTCDLIEKLQTLGSLSREAALLVRANATSPPTGRSMRCTSPR